MFKKLTTDFNEMLWVKTKGDMKNMINLQKLSYENRSLYSCITPVCLLDSTFSDYCDLICCF